MNYTNRIEFEELALFMKKGFGEELSLINFKDRILREHANNGQGLS